MNNIISVIESVHPKLTKLELTGLQDLIEIFAVLGLNRLDRFCPRVVEDSDLDEVYINRVADLLGLSRSDIRRLIKCGGLKVNNKVIPETTTLIDLPWIELEGWRVCIIKKGKNEFDFILW